MKRLKKISVLLLLSVLIGGGILYFRDTTPPTMTLAPAAGPLSGKTPLTLQLADAGAGLQELTVSAVQGDKTLPLLAKTYPAGTASASEDLDLGSLKLKEGPFEIRVVAGDHSRYHFGHGNRLETAVAFVYDSKAPLISVATGAHNFNRGGSGLILYGLSEEVERSGVQVGERFFPGFQLTSGQYACLFAFPYELKVAAFVPKLTAVDLAGNERQVGFYYHANHRDFRQRQINIDQRFLDAKGDEFQDLAPEAQSPLEAFLLVNREVRQKNRAALADFSRQTAAAPLWDGPFLRQPQAATLALFADDRTYLFDGKKIDQQTHLGIDLASTAQAPVLAANRGRVVFADYMGIYGLCVIIDHGLGLQSLYGHLSRIEVQTGDEVTKGQIVGNSGATGMAGGDHLHFGLILSGLPVSPTEWWDATWLENNITSKLRATGN